MLLQKIKYLIKKKILNKKKYKPTLLEKQIFKKYSNDLKNIPIIFLIASPRTGSTFFFQLLIKIFQFSYFSNFTNTFSSHNPIIGYLIERNLNQNKQISLESFYGQTKHLHEPSEATNILNNWFEFGHPSEILGRKIRKGKLKHMEKTFSAIYNYSKKPIIIKNAWNGYRIEELTKVFKNSYFVWLRRDIINSSYSDLIARKRIGNPSKVWSSATPRNYKTIQKLHYTEQVVENQYLFNKKVSEDLLKFVNNKYMEVWYENLGKEKKKIFKLLSEDLEKKFNFPISIKHDELNKCDIEISNTEFQDNDFRKIKVYATKKYPNYCK